MRVLVIDGQGGGLGRQLVAAISAACPDAELTAVGTNSLAASAMLKAALPAPLPAKTPSSSTPAVRTSSWARWASSSRTPLLGEITPAMAAAVGQADAKRILIPVNHCDNYVVGIADVPVGALVQSAAQRVRALWEGHC